MKALFDLLLPRRCFGCKEVLNAGERVLCTHCRHEMPLTLFHFLEENEMDRSLYGRGPFTKASSFLYFKTPGIGSALIHQLKYQDQEHLGKFLGAWYGSVLAGDPGLPLLEGIVGVPIHWIKKTQRGYNQLEALGRQLSLHLKAPYLSNALVKTSLKTSQTKKSRLRRNLKGTNPFRVKRPEQLFQKKILLIDDVMTTGATLSLCLKALEEAKPAAVYIATLGFVSRFP